MVNCAKERGAALFSKGTAAVLATSKEKRNNVGLTRILIQRWKEWVGGWLWFSELAKERNIKGLIKTLERSSNTEQKQNDCRMPKRKEIQADFNLHGTGLFPSTDSSATRVRGPCSRAPLASAESRVARLRSMPFRLCQATKVLNPSGSSKYRLCLFYFILTVSFWCSRVLLSVIRC